MQAACAAFLAAGDLDRHLRRTRRVYRDRRDALVSALERWLPEASTTGISAGLHVLVTLPEQCDEAVIAARARDAGVGVYPLGDYHARRDRALPPGFVLGYGPLSPNASARGVRILADVVASTD
jgi:GntR family transcriptional regulator / MocR family aminotransferase